MDPKIERCEAISHTNLWPAKDGQCSLPATHKYQQHACCWTHFKAANNPERLLPLKWVQPTYVRTF